MISCFPTKRMAFGTRTSTSATIQGHFAISVVYCKQTTRASHGPPALPYDIRKERWIYFNSLCHIRQQSRTYRLASKLQWLIQHISQICKTEFFFVWSKNLLSASRTKDSTHMDRAKWNRLCESSSGHQIVVCQRAGAVSEMTDPVIFGSSGGLAEMAMTHLRSWWTQFSDACAAWPACGSFQSLQSNRGVNLENLFGAAFECTNTNWLHIPSSLGKTMPSPLQKCLQFSCQKMVRGYFSPHKSTDWHNRRGPRTR